MDQDFQGWGDHIKIGWDESGINWDILKMVLGFID